MRTRLRRRLALCASTGAMVAALIGGSVAVQPSAAAQSARPPDLAKVLKRLDELYTAKSSQSVAELIVVTPRQTRKLRMNIWTKGDDHALVVIQAPARERGTATLKVGDNLWNYLPRISRTIRVPPSMMLASWMGSDFTNDDLVHESSYRKDFESSWAGRSKDPAGWLLRMDARKGVVGRWARIDMVLSDDGMVPLEARYYDRHGRLARTMKFDEVRNIDGRPIPMHLVLTPKDEAGHRTELRYLELKLNVPVSGSMFSLSELEQSR